MNPEKSDVVFCLEQTVAQNCKSFSAVSAKTIARCIVDSQIDYCNALLIEATWRTFAKIQRVQTNLVRLVFDVSIWNQFNLQKHI